MYMYNLHFFLSSCSYVVFPPIFLLQFFSFLRSPFVAQSSVVGVDMREDCFREKVFLHSFDEVQGYIDFETRSKHICDYLVL